MNDWYYFGGLHLEIGDDLLKLDSNHSWTSVMIRKAVVSRMYEQRSQLGAIKCTVTVM